MARRTPLDKWIMGINNLQNIHAIELSLLQQYRGYVDEVAGWLPEEWEAPVKWIKRLPDLPALLHLLEGFAAPNWLLNDPVLKPLASEQKKLRMNALTDSVYSPLVKRWQRGLPLHVAWLEHWKSLLPSRAEKEDGIRRLLHLYQSSCEVQPATVNLDTWQQRQLLEEQLTSIFRGNSFQAAATFAHLGLIAIDMAKLRRAINQRLLFPDTLKAAS
jgi:hypothetical protein